jgi:hypothetical protein
MKVKVFKYMKENTVKEYDVMVLKEVVGAIEGISVKDIPEGERAKITEIFKEFEEKLNPYMKYYRRFTTDKSIPSTPALVAEDK